MTEDEQHLDLLAIFHYIVGGMKDPVKQLFTAGNGAQGSLAGSVP